MPELPEVETVRLGLMPVLQGRRLVAVTQRRRDLRFPLPVAFAERLTGRSVRDIERLGKFLLIRLDDGWIWLVHLGMSGSFRIAAAGASDSAADRHDHVLVSTDAGACISFHDPRRFGFMDLVPADGVATHPRLAGLGPDPLGPAFTAAYLGDRLAGRQAPLKARLLDQHVVAGMGNIYASESLFRARLAPTRPSATVGGRRLGLLVRAIRGVFADAIAAGGASLRDHRRPSGELGCFQHAFAVYGREGERCPGCRCDAGVTGGVRRIVQSGRSTYYCAHRQGWPETANTLDKPGKGGTR
jgi:formamidopyrimidine-DNA glycosylase